MKDSIKNVEEGGKYFGCAADELTPQACYRSGVAGVCLSRGHILLRAGQAGGRLMEGYQYKAVRPLSSDGAAQ